MLHDLFTRGIDIQTGRLHPSYQDAPEWYKESKLGLIPREWEVKELGDIGEVRMCRRIFNFETSDQGDIPFLKSEHLENSQMLTYRKNFIIAIDSDSHFPKKETF